MSKRLSETEREAVGFKDLLCDRWQFTQHAITRFRSRARDVGCKQSDETVLNKMVQMLATRKHLGGDRYYTNKHRCGLVWVIEGKQVITVMRPTKADLQRRVWKAHNDKLSEPGAKN